MHELSLVEALVEQALEAVRENAAGKKINAVDIDVGELSGAVPELLRDLYPMVAESTVLEGSRLHVRKIRARFECAGCGKKFGRQDMPGCPGCGSMNVDLLRGREIRLTAIDVEE